MSPCWAWVLRQPGNPGNAVKNAGMVMGPRGIPGRLAEIVMRQGGEELVVPLGLDE